jgi:hypothetical protein
MPDHYEDKIDFMPMPRCMVHRIVEWKRGSNFVVTGKNSFAFNFDSQSLLLYFYFSLSIFGLYLVV